MTATKNLIQAAAGAAGAGFYDYTINNSARFNQEASPLSRTPSSGNNTTWTFSCWIKTTYNHGNGGTANLLQASGSGVDTSIRMTDSKNGTYPGILWPYAYNNGYVGQDRTNAVYRDVSSWYHVLWVVDTTDATEADRSILYVNGVRQDVTQDYAWTSSGNTGVWTQTNYLMRHFGGYAADVIMLDGTAASPTDLGEDKNGVWVPKNPSGLTFGTNGFWLDFADSSNLGNDVSGNNNDFTVSGLTSSDQMTDTPTNNFPTMNVLDGDSSATFSEGNLSINHGQSGTWRSYQSTMSFDIADDYYVEFTADNTTNGNVIVGIVEEVFSGKILHSTWNRFWGGEQSGTTGYGYFGNNGDVYSSSSAVTTESTYTTGDVIGVHVSSGSLTFYKNNVSQGVAVSGLSGRWKFAGALYVSGDDVSVNFGQSGFTYTPPSGAVALCTANLPEPTIGPNTSTQSDDHFNTVLYTGNGSSQNITGFGFNPDMVWHKGRSVAYSHSIVDVIRGNSNVMFTNSTDAEQNPGAQLDLITDGATVTYRSANLANNQSGATYVIWGWKGNGSGVSNTDGTITSTVSANTNAGFSIVTYTGNGTDGATVGHGLNQKVDMIIVKNRDGGTLDNAGGWWIVKHKDAGSLTSLYQHYGFSTNPFDSSSGAHGYLTINNTTTVTLNVGSNTGPIGGDESEFWWVNKTGTKYIAYCFHSVEGFSKFGSYTGNGSTDGPFIYTGMRPAWILWKSSSNAYGWGILDTARDTYNVADSQLYPHLSNAESSDATYNCDILSNGFKIRNSNAVQNQSSATYIYMAFAENPFKYANAR